MAWLASGSMTVVSWLSSAPVPAACQGERTQAWSAGSAALAELAAVVDGGVGTPAGATRRASDRASALLTAAAHTLLTRAAALESPHADGTITALTALALVPNLRDRLARVEALGPADAARVSHAVSAMEAIGLAPVRSLAPDASGWECDDALAEMLWPLRAILPSGADLGSAWPGSGSESPLELLSAITSPPAASEPWASLAPLVAEWRQLVASKGSHEVVFASAQSLVDLHAIVERGQSSKAVQGAQAGLFRRFESATIAQVLSHQTRIGTLRSLPARLEVLCESVLALEHSAAAREAPTPRRFAEQARQSSIDLVDAHGALSVAMATALASPGIDQGDRWRALEEPTASCRRATITKVRWQELDRGIEGAAVSPTLRQALARRLPRADPEVIDLFVRSTTLDAPVVGETPPDGAFRLAALEMRRRWAVAITEGGHEADALAATLRLYLDVHEWASLVDALTPEAVAMLPRWGGWEPAPGGNLAGLSRLRGAVRVARDDLTRGDLTSAEPILVEARSAIPDATVASILCRALARSADELPPAGESILARVLAAPGANAVLAGSRALLERLTRARLSERHARQSKDATSALAAQAVLSSLAEELREACREE
ncbi:MAG: hypothetical protein O2819_05845 [Planctomycetota bacterium]|nr:hypothetical protein [Planctomycetota bacterium]